ncbi:MAG TPA: PorV/PorQ family protein [bacterium]|nr:PorV/PorQ family protein [bacterium]
MNRFRKILPPLFVLALPSLCAAGFTLLQAGLDARGAAMGFTGAASSTGASAMYWNPALLAVSPSPEAALTVNRWIQEVQAGAFAFSRSGFGLSLHYSHVGGIEHRIVPSEQPVGTFSANDAVFGIAYARRVSPAFSFGVRLNGYYEKIYIDEATGIGGDLGMVWSPGLSGLRIGAAVQHIGKTGKLRQDAVQLPLTIRVGAGYRTAGPGGRWEAAVECVRIRGGDPGVHTGLEWVGFGRIALRAGYQSGHETRGLTAGIGFDLEKIRISYGFIPFRSGLGDAHSLTAVFSL